MHRSPSLLVAAVVLVAVFLSASDAAAARQPAPASHTSRMSVQRVEPGRAPGLEAMAARLADCYAAPPGQQFADRRVFSIRPNSGSATRFEATIYDYSYQQAFDLLIDGEGNELTRVPLAIQPPPTSGELQDAMSVVRRNPAWGARLASDSLRVYEAMPPVTVAPDGRRLINVGLMSPPEAGSPTATNEVVSVDIPAGKVVRYDSGAPATSRAAFLACGPAQSPCPATSGSCGGSYHVEWPLPNPVWKFNVRHPSCTTTGPLGQNDGTGLELTAVYYKDMLVLESAQVPVLNVTYQGDACGPYRDWLFAENCFSANGVDVPSSDSGIRDTTGNPAPATLCESGTDAGNFKGVAIHDEGNSLWLVTEMNAGWYHYSMEWRLRLDGTIEPRFGIAATANSCTCNVHTHHVYWRMEWALGGASGLPGSGVATLERRVAGTSDQYDPIANEGTFVRPPADPSLDGFRVRDPVAGTTFLIEPGAEDGSADGDPFGKWDLAALAWNPSQINDPNFPDTRISLEPWLNGESLGAAQRLVTWYHVAQTHDDSGGTGEECSLQGPQLVGIFPCEGKVALDAERYSCAASVTVTVDDSDLQNAGTTTVALSSDTETTPETVTLVESPAGSGHFTGTMPTTGGPAVSGDGVLSAADADLIRASYTDSSACGTPNVIVEKTAVADCAPPTLSNVQALVEGIGALVTWSSDQPSTSIVHFGTSTSGGSSLSSPGSTTSHAVQLEGLEECTTYYYWVESQNAYGQTASSNTGGGYYAFTTGKNAKQPEASCSPAVPPPPAVDGLQGPAMLASALAPDRRSIQLSWDVTSCPAKNYHLVFGPLGTLSSYSLSGGACGLGPLGSFVWDDAPPGDLWFLVVSDDADLVEGTWGQDGAGASIAGGTASGVCGFNTRDNSGTCP